jgi:hypothetical protein
MSMRDVGVGDAVEDRLDATRNGEGGRMQVLIYRDINWLDTAHGVGFSKIIS